MTKNMTFGIPSRFIFGAGILAFLWPAIDETLRLLVKRFWGDTQANKIPLTNDRVDFMIPMAADTAGTYQTLAVMARLVRIGARDPAIRDFSSRLVAGCSGHDFDAEIRRCFEFARDGITYRKDPAELERVQAPRRTLFEYRCGDCDDKVVALGSMLGALGHQSRFVIVGPSRDGNFSHVYLEARTRRGWLALDPTNEKALAGWETPQPARKQVFHIF